jgi:hypothetical protein
MLFFLELGLSHGNPGAVYQTRTPTASACVPLPILNKFGVFSLLVPPYVGVTVDTTQAVTTWPPRIYVTNGTYLIDLSSNESPFPLMSPAFVPVTDLDFASTPTHYGTGCGVTPTMRITGGLPYMGNAGFTLSAGPTVGNLGILLLSGASTFTPLTPSCMRHVTWPWISSLAVPVVGGTADALLPIPVCPILVGIPVYTQWVFFPGATPEGFELSDAMEITVGLP